MLTPPYFTVSKVFSEVLDLHHTHFFLAKGFWLVWQQNIAYTATGSLLYHLPFPDHLKQHQLCIYYFFSWFSQFVTWIMTSKLEELNLEYAVVTLNIPIIVGSITGTSQFNSNCVLIMASATLWQKTTTTVHQFRRTFWT